MSDKEKDRNDENLLNAGIAGASSEVVQRYGAAVKEHFVAYSGKDNEIGKTLTKGLKSISKEKINPDYQYQNIHQQAGFSAEVKEVANTNADNIIKGIKNRKIRTDDMGRVNDPLYDHVEIDINGNVIDGSGTQMKFIGASQNDPTGEGAPARVLEKLQSKKFEKYLDNDVKITVPSDQYEKIILETDRKIDILNKQYDRTAGDGKTEQTEKIAKQIEKLEKIKKNLRKSSVTSKEALFARRHPKLSTAKSVVKVSHKAGIKTAGSAAIIGGSVSIVKNLVAVIKGEEEPQEAAASVAKDTASSMAFGYGTGFLGSAVKGAMQNVPSDSVKALAGTNLPATLVAVGIAATKTLKRYFEGEIDGVQCFEELGEQGTGMLSSALFAAVGKMVIPIPAVGGLIGGMVGYALSSASYGILMDALKEEKLAHERRIEIEQVCAEHIEMIRAYRGEMECIINEYLVSNMSTFHDAFCELKKSLSVNDIDEWIGAANSISETLGKQSQYSCFNEFDDIMNSSNSFRM